MNTVSRTHCPIHVFALTILFFASLEIFAPTEARADTLKCPPKDAALLMVKALGGSTKKGRNGAYIWTGRGGSNWSKFKARSQIGKLGRDTNAVVSISFEQASGNLARSIRAIYKINVRDSRSGKVKPVAYRTAVHSVLYRYMDPVCSNTNWDDVRKKRLTKATSSRGTSTTNSKGKTIKSIKEFCEEFGDDYIRQYYKGSSVPYREWGWERGSLTYRKPRIKKIYGDIQVEACIGRDGYVFGPVRFVGNNGRGKTLMETFALKGDLHGPYTEWNKQGTLVSLGSFDSGKVNGIWLDFDDQGVPIRFLEYKMANTTREATLCAGQCVSSFSHVPYLSASKYDRYPKHAGFLAYMDGALALEKAKLAAQKAAWERLQREIAAKNKRRYAASMAAGGQTAVRVVLNTIGNEGCHSIGMPTHHLRQDGWFKVRGAASCKHKKYNFMVARKYEVSVAQKVNGGWTTQYGISWRDY